MEQGFNDTFLTLGLMALGIYFSVLLLRGLAGYFPSRMARETAPYEAAETLPAASHLRRPTRLVGRRFANQIKRSDWQ